MEGSQQKKLFETIYDSLINMGLVEDTDLTTQDIGKIANRLLFDIQFANYTKVEKFLFVEDGSVDIDELGSLAITNPEIKVLVVRQGGRIPELKEVK